MNGNFASGFDKPYSKGIGQHLRIKNVENPPI